MQIIFQRRNTKGARGKSTDRRLADASICSYDPQACLSDWEEMSFGAVGLGWTRYNRRASSKEGRWWKDAEFYILQLIRT